MENLATLLIYLGFVAAPLLPILMLRAIKKIYNKDDYVPEVAGIIICTLILWVKFIM